MNTLQFPVKEIKVVQGLVEYDLKTTLEQAHRLQTLLETIEVDEDTVKSAKKLLANINKRVKALETRRIEVKKELLEPYLEFEKEVKEIVRIVNEANELVKSQVRELEEQERDEKEAKIREIWDQRFAQYPFDFVEFDDFLTPQHLNKSVTMKNVEKDMVEFLENILKDTQVISKMDDPNGIMACYLETLTLSEALTVYQHRKEIAEKVKPIDDDDVEIEQTFDVRIFGKKDIRLVKNFLEDMDIEHREI